MSLEVGYMGRRIQHEFAEVDLDSVPYMMTLGGQTFADAYAKLYVAMCGLGPTCANTTYSGAAQPFFEAALTPGSGYCATFTSCTLAVATKEASNFANVQVSTLWANLNSGAGWKLGRTMLSDQATTIGLKSALGYGNYNAAFFTFRVRDWHGITAVSNFTWGRALGLGANTQRSSGTNFVDVYNLRGNYGPNDFDYKFLYSLGVTYRPDFFKSTKGFIGQLINGWSVSPFLSARSGGPTRINWSGVTGCGSDCQAFGQTGNSNGGAQGPESAIPIGPYNIRPTANRGVFGSNGVGTTNAEGINMFANPEAVYNLFRRCVLGLDTNCGGGAGNLRGLNRWNVDATLAKDIKITERIGLQFTMQFTNVFNHFQPGDPRDASADNLRLNQKQNFGRITSAAYDPRQVEWGMRIHF
jgi:hypothetical protein